MSNDQVHLVKLCVGANAVEDIVRWQARRAEQFGAGYLPYHVTRMWPKRADDILNGGSLYWVFKGFILARQTILRLEPEDGSDGIRRCKIVMSREIVRTQAAPRRPFQGWRYLKTGDAPPDLPKGHELDDELPNALNLALTEIGVR